MREPGDAPSQTHDADVNDDRHGLDGHAVQLEALGVTLFGVILSIGVTVGLGVKGAWWVRLASGLGSFVLLLVLFGVVARPGRGPLSRLARWLTRR